MAVELASHSQISRLLQLFLAYEEDPSVNLVILKGLGRAFCAGGDVAAVVRDIEQGNWRLGAKFFSDEYMLNYVMATYSKAQISILNGIVMGGGAGVSVHGRFRIATESTVFAMPETALGLFPDIGASYFLSRLPGFFGEYVGLTGARLDGAEMLACGLATHFVPSKRLTALEADLCKIGSSDPTFASTVLDAYTQQPRLKQQSAYHRQEREATQEADGWIPATILALKKASPASLKISLRSIREGRLQGVGQCLIREFRMWEPRRLEDMKDSMVEQYFERMGEEEEWEDLKLLSRKNLPGLAIAKL
ncbi:hypothetical protein CARUB_v10027960mg [Capsella rubella]|uniref:3-hydroxyisobutyryl-CoA hydrolase n=1 Tax=Capsella rubella TaxID=81985 RepID=R0GU36_9BRAS|nr:hypothetical protein CARUB_v10027960mg [Capsella rubella]